MGSKCEYCGIEGKFVAWLGYEEEGERVALFQCPKCKTVWADIDP